MTGVTLPARARLALCFGASLAALELHGQELTGTLRMVDEASPAANVLIVATRPGSDSVVARALSGVRGQYVLRLSPGVARVQVLRIGQAPYDLGTFTLDAGERRVADATLPHMPVTLRPVLSEASGECRAHAAAGPTVATLHQEVRKALLATTMVSTDAPPVSRFLLFSELRDNAGRLVGQPQHLLKTGSSLRPFGSVSPELLALEGYVKFDGDGTVFRAPDAPVLLSPSFLDGHCFRLVQGRGERAAWIGLGFEPTPTRPRRISRTPVTQPVIGIRGVLWIDGATTELRRLEYSYVGLNAPLNQADLGGSVDYTRLPNGHWFESHWEIRMPHVRTRSAATGSFSNRNARDLIVDVTGIERTGGRVLVLERGDELLFSGGIEALRLAVGPDIGARSDSLAYKAALACRNAVGDSAVVYGMVLDRDARATGDASVMAQWQHSFRLVGRGEFQWRVEELTTTTAPDGSYAVCGTPRGRLVTMTASKEGTRSTPVGVRVPEYEDRARADLRLTVPSRKR